MVTSYEDQDEMEEQSKEVGGEAPSSINIKKISSAVDNDVQDEDEDVDEYQLDFDHNDSPKRSELGKDGLPKAAQPNEDEEEEDEDEYYADDKFVYEDVAEDPSSEDAEQKFLKHHAEMTARKE